MWRQPSNLPTVHRAKLDLLPRLQGKPALQVYLWPRAVRKWSGHPEGSFRPRTRTKTKSKDRYKHRCCFATGRGLERLYGTTVRLGDRDPSTARLVHFVNQSLRSG